MSSTANYHKSMLGCLIVVLFPPLRDIRRSKEFTLNISFSDPAPAFLTVQEVATMLRVRPRAIYGWIHAGLFPSAVKVAGTYRIDRAHLLAELRESGKAATHARAHTTSK